MIVNCAQKEEEGRLKFGKNTTRQTESYFSLSCEAQKRTFYVSHQTISQLRKIKSLSRDSRSVMYKLCVHYKHTHAHIVNKEKEKMSDRVQSFMYIQGKGIQYSYTYIQLRYCC